MSARIILEVALRVLGFWFLFTSLTTLTSTVSLYLTNAWYSAAPGILNLVMSSGATFSVQFLLGVALICWAPMVAARFYPHDTEISASEIRVGPGDVYRTACFVLGAYLLVRAAEPAAELTVAVFQRTQAAQFSGQMISSAITSVVYAASGTLLVFGSRPIAELLLNLRYDPDTIPKQQISLAMLLILIVLFAVVLGVMRRMAL